MKLWRMRLTPERVWLAAQTRNKPRHAVHNDCKRPCDNRHPPPVAPPALCAAAQDEDALVHRQSGSLAKGCLPGRAPRRGECRGTVLDCAAGPSLLRTHGSESLP